MIFNKNCVIFLLIKPWREKSVYIKISHTLYKSCNIHPMRKPALLPILLFLALPSLFAQTQTATLMHNGLLREYRLYVPPSYNPQSPAPLVFSLHGYTSNGLEQELYSAFNPLADTFGFIVVYPNGISETWNAGFIAGGVDDVGFISALIDHIGSQYYLDAQRIYATGMSNGGFMSYYLACQLEDRIAAIASVAGNMSLNVQNTCQSVRKVPVLEMHGTADGVVPYNESFLLPSVPFTVNFWVNRNGCDPTPDSLNLPDLVNEGSTVTRFYWNGPPGTSEVYLYRINGGGHSWPGAFPVPGVNTNQDIRGSRLIWDFFSAHLHPSPAPLLTAVGPDRLPSSLHIWPNPAHEVIRISDIPASAERLRVTDAMGRVVYEEGIGEI
ncbi:MAG: hypothetical protein EAZ89_18020, partial [Bacteroidetes bacterium]